jgi:hypothetical protein
MLHSFPYIMDAFDEKVEVLVSKLEAVWVDINKIRLQLGMDELQLLEIEASKQRRLETRGGRTEVGCESVSTLPV